MKLSTTDVAEILNDYPRVWSDSGQTLENMVDTCERVKDKNKLFLEGSRIAYRHGTFYLNEIMITEIKPSNAEDVLNKIINKMLELSKKTQATEVDKGYYIGCLTILFQLHQLKRSLNEPIRDRKKK